MRAELPIIATEVGAIPDMIEDGKSGLLIKPRESKQIVDAVIRLSEDQALCRSLAESSRKVFEERFELSGCMKEMVALYREVM